jgi:hypothetical protein
VPAAFFQNHPWLDATVKSIHQGEYIITRLTKQQREHNQERVDHASDIIERYKSRVTGEDAATCLRDILADLMHFAKANRLHFEDELATARNYFDDERNGLM